VTRTHTTRPGWGETHTLCGLDLNPSCGSHNAQPTLSTAPTCHTCRRLAAPKAQPHREPEERKCTAWLAHLGRECGLDEGLHTFINHTFQARNLS
jgi:hypothetical protein